MSNFYLKVITHHFIRELLIPNWVKNIPLNMLLTITLNQELIPRKLYKFKD